MKTAGLIFAVVFAVLSVAANIAYAFNWQQALESAGVGAITGAVIGSAFPALGTIAGAGIGAAIGFAVNSINQLLFAPPPAGSSGTTWSSYVQEAAAQFSNQATIARMMEQNQNETMFQSALLFRETAQAWELSHYNKNDNPAQNVTLVAQMLYDTHFAQYVAGVVFQLEHLWYQLDQEMCTFNQNLQSTVQGYSVTADGQTCPLGNVGFQLWVNGYQDYIIYTTGAVNVSWIAAMSGTNGGVTFYTLNGTQVASFSGFQSTAQVNLTAGYYIMDATFDGHLSVFSNENAVALLFDPAWSGTQPFQQQNCGNYVFCPSAFSGMMHVDWGKVYYNTPTSSNYYNVTSNGSLEYIFNDVLALADDMLQGAVLEYSVLSALGYQNGSQVPPNMTLPFLTLQVPLPSNFSNLSYAQQLQLLTQLYAKYLESILLTLQHLNQTGQLQGLKNLTISAPLVEWGAYGGITVTSGEVILPNNQVLLPNGSAFLVVPTYAPITLHTGINTLNASAEIIQLEPTSAGYVAGAFYTVPQGTEIIVNAMLYNGQNTQQATVEPLTYAQYVNPSLATAPSPTGISGSISIFLTQHWKAVLIGVGVFLLILIIVALAAGAGGGGRVVVVSGSTRAVSLRKEVRI